jgi:hypothetical protein
MIFRCLDRRRRIERVRPVPVLWAQATGSARTGLARRQSASVPYGIAFTLYQPRKLLSIRAYARCATEPCAALRLGSSVAAMRRHIVARRPRWLPRSC